MLRVPPGPGGGAGGVPVGGGGGGEPAPDGHARAPPARPKEAGRGSRFSATRLRRWPAAAASFSPAQAPRRRRRHGCRRRSRHGRRPLCRRHPRRRPRRHLAFSDYFLFQFFSIDFLLLVSRLLKFFQLHYLCISPKSSLFFLSLFWAPCGTIILL